MVINADFEFDPIEGEEVYSSVSPADTQRTCGRSCGIAFFKNQDRKTWTLAFRYTKSDLFTTPDETNVQDTIEVQGIWEATRTVLKYDMPDHFKIDFSVVSHCALIGTIVGIYDRLNAAWGNEIAKFTNAVAENHWEWDKLDSMT